MIKINLVRNRVGSSSGETQIIDTGSVSSSGNRELLVKFAMLSLFTIALILYESSNVGGLKAQQADLQNQLTQLQTESAAKAAEVEAVKDVEVQAKELQDKIKLIKLLSQLRLREVKTLDFMQSSIPEKVWLSTLNFETEKDKMEEGRFSFSGNAMTTEDLGEFVKRLENSGYLEQVIVVKNQEIQVPNASSYREFLFTAEVENMK